jgi:hypothetical protein
MSNDTSFDGWMKAMITSLRKTSLQTTKEVEALKRITYLNDRCKSSDNKHTEGK